jgi:hypothetical protein
MKVNGKDDIPYMKWKKKVMFETNKQKVSVIFSVTEKEKMVSESLQLVKKFFLQLKPRIITQRITTIYYVF